MPTADRERVVQLEHATAEKNVLLVHSTFISLHFTEGHISEISGSSCPLAAFRSLSCSGSNSGGGFLERLFIV